MYRVLFITDDWKHKKDLKSGMLEAGFSVVQAGSQEALGEKFVPSKIDLLVVDLEHCATDNGKLCRALKGERIFRDLPLVLLVTEEQLGGLDFAWGLEDYLAHPVSAKRLEGRLKFLLWKLNRIHMKNVFSQDGLTVDFERYEVHVKGKSVDLTYKEFELLKFLLAHPGRVFTREALLDKVWGYDFYGGTRTVDVHIRRLRSKIEAGDRIFIETIRNVGYKFIGRTVD